MAQKIIQVLHVEDDPADILLMQEMLHSTGSEISYNIVNVSSLVEVMRIVSIEHFDVILLDLGLKDACGIDVVTSVIAMAPNIPIIILTGMNNDDIAIQALYDGAQEFLVKGRFDSELIKLSIINSINRFRDARCG